MSTSFVVYFKEIKFDHRKLFLLVNVVSLGVSSSLGSDSMETLVGTSLSDGLESLEALQLISKFQDLELLGLLLDGHQRSRQLDSLGEFLRSGVSLPWLLGVEREEDELALVFLQTLSVQLKGLNTLVPSNI